MNFFSVITPNAWFAIGIGAALLVLLVLELYNSRRVNRLTYPVYEYALKRAEEEANRIVEQGRREARQLIEKAEADSLTLATARQNEEEVSKQAYEKALQTMLERLESELGKNANETRDAQARMTTV